MADPISQYCITKTNSSYDSSSKVLTEMAKVGDKKKNYSKVITAMKALLYYRLDTSLRISMIGFATFRDPTIQRLAYYFLGYPPLARLQSTDGLSVLKADLGEKTPMAKKIVSLRTFCRVLELESNDVDSIYNTIIADSLNEETTTDKKLKKKRDEVIRQMKVLRHSTLLSHRLRFKPQASLLQPILDSLESYEDMSTTRHTVALLLRYSENGEYTQQVAEHMMRHTPQYDKENPASLNYLTEDVFARVYFVRLLAFFSNPANLKGRDAQATAEFYYQALCQFVLDRHLKVCFEAVSCLCALEWERLAKAEFIPHRDDLEFLYAVHNPSVLENIQKRIILALNSTGNHTSSYIHGAIRVATILAKTYFRSPANDDLHPLRLLFDPFQLLLKTATPQIRLNTLILFVWLAHPRESALVNNIVHRELLADNLTSPIIERLCDEMLQRIQCTRIVIPLVLDFLFMISTMKPELASVSQMMGIWEAVIHLDGEAGKQRVQQNAFNILDHHHTEQNQGMMMKLHQATLYFLGESAHSLCERTDHPLTLKNPYLKSVILRLQSAALFTLLETRVVAIDGLFKIAIRLKGEILRDILRFLSNDPCIGDCIGDFSHMLDVLTKLSVESLSNEVKATINKEVALYCSIAV